MTEISHRFDHAGADASTSSRFERLWPLTYALATGSNAATAGTFGTIQVNPRTYTYTLTTPFDTTPDADNGGQHGGGKDSFSYTVTDAQGNSATGTITGQHRRRRSDGDVGQRQCERRRAADGCGVRGAVERRCRRRRLYGRRRGCRGSRGGQ